MTSVNFAPLFRTAIGFDRLARLVDTAASSQEAQTYPPYNIEKTGDDSYRITMAVAGFRPEDLDITVKDNMLFVSGRVANEGQPAEVLYRGIAGRAFERPAVFLRDQLRAARLFCGPIGVERGRRPDARADTDACVV